MEVIKLFNIKLDFSNSKDIKVDNKEIPFWDENSLIGFVCDTLYEKNVKFIVSDNYCSDYGMNCKFDLPCLLELYEDIICALLNRQDFSIEFYEQGREYFISVIIYNDDVKLNIRYGYDDIWYKEELTYCYIKKIFVNFYEVLFEDINKCFRNIEKNPIFINWTAKLNELKLN